MDNKWYRDLVNLIKINLDRILFIKDIDKLISIEEFASILKDFVDEIFEFKSELKLRMKISKEDKTYIIIFNDEKKIPYDFFNRFPILEIGLKDIFLNLDKTELSKININNLDKIYREYTLNNEKYIQKTKQETEGLVKYYKEKVENNSNGKNKNQIKEKIEDKINELELKLKENENIEDIKFYFEIVKLIGEINYIISQTDCIYDLENLLVKSDSLFREYIFNKYNNLAFDNRFEYSPLNNHILDYISKYDKVALICFDCMSFSEWYVLKNYLEKNNIKNIKESFSFAMIPSITKYSRLAIFEGKLPVYSEENNEEKAFKKYFELTKNNSKNVYFKNIKDDNDLNFLGYEKIGLVYNFIDDIVHGSINKKMVLSNVREFMYSSNIIKVIDELLKNKFKVYICSDHGNVFCKTNGVNISKFLVNEKDTRAAIFPTKNLAKDVKLESKVVLSLNNILGNDKYIVIDSKRRNFGNRKNGLSHGGISVEEMIVPFIEIGGE